ncbi:MBL fold metallo-hydrolase [Sphingomonas sp. BIUV-7]|uniref:MBL fold metallo-hydrolase n=1 Tax=Sphingomonas natans TaxID=3063330 RepID=A0ABT8YEY2_9SPHN|nr:MBL fold metallo-hydrolase [Sphingomonas sp. BIUV-7]MDO6416913.1 MBL fold metallo-hydrolase [Sphingomonas sp. BIUV-7]
MTGSATLRTTLRLLGAGLLWLVIVLLLAPVVIPPFLDRIYYRGPKSAHYDGAHFFNPDGEYGTGGTQRRPPAATFVRFLLGQDRSAWPEHIDVAPGYPAAQGTPCPAAKARIVESWARCVPKVDPRRMFVTWIGHATVLIQAGGINILTDPIYATHSGPFGVTGPSRVRDPGIRFEDLPRIDLVLVSHDHWDHMDLATLRRLWERDRPLIVTSLGNDTVIAGSGAKAVAKDWGERITVRPGIDVIIERVHHWGSRWMSDRNRALWSGFTVTLPGGNLFFAGDTGWGDGSWPAEAARDGPYRLALLPIGAWQPRALMSGNHIGPAEAVAAFQTLGAAHALAIHWGTFRLSNEGIDEPPALLAKTLADKGIKRDRFRALEVGRNWEVPALPGR